MNQRVYCSCDECAHGGKRVQMAMLEERGGESVLVITDKRHGQRHELLVPLDKAKAAAPE